MAVIKGSPRLKDEQIYSILMEYESSREGIITRNDCNRAISEMIKKEGKYDFDKAEEIYGEFSENHEIMESQRFKLEMLVGHGEIISYRKIGDISPYNPEVENKPENLKVFEFENGSFFAMQEWGDGECGHIKAYFYDSILKKIVYDDLI